MVVTWEERKSVRDSFRVHIALRKGDGENARPLPCRTTRTRSSLLPQLSHSGPSSNGCFSQPAISGTPVTSSGTPPLLPPKIAGWLKQPFELGPEDRKSTRLNSSHQIISYAV